MAVKRAKKAKTTSTKTWQQLRKQGDKGWYAAYQRSHHWRRLRKKLLEARRYRCEHCGKEDPYRDEKRGFRLHVHHLTYERLGKERLEDLQALCRDCHRLAHKSGNAVAEVASRVMRLLR
jgi:5-methylcytosine-specific restriction endonuclease McrA